MVILVAAGYVAAMSQPRHGPQRSGRPGSSTDPGAIAQAAVGKRTLVERSGAASTAAVQRMATGGAAVGGSDAVKAAAAHGTSGRSEPLPHLDRIQRLFGRHDVSGVRAHVGGAAAEGAAAMGAAAFATGNQVAFGATPDLHTAAHVVQQRAGVQLKGGVSSVGDEYERHADAVADRVVRGESAEALLGEPAASHGFSTGAPVQRLEYEEAEKFVGMVGWILKMNGIVDPVRKHLLQRAEEIALRAATMEEARNAMDREFPWNQPGGSSSASRDDDRGSSSASRDDGKTVMLFLKLVTGESPHVEIPALDLGVDAKILHEVALSRLNDALVQRSGKPIPIEMLALSYAGKRLPMTGGCALTRDATVQVAIDTKKKPKTESEKIEDMTVDSDLVAFASKMDEVVMFSFINTPCDEKLREQQNLDTFISAIKGNNPIRQAFIDPNFGTRPHHGQIASRLEQLFGIEFHLKTMTIGASEAWVYTYKSVEITYIAKWLNEPTMAELKSETRARMF